MSIEIILILTCRPALAECDFCLCGVVSLGPAFPPVDLPFPPAISRSMLFEALDGSEARYATLME